MELTFHITASKPLYMQNLLKIVSKNIPTLKLTTVASTTLDVRLHAVSESAADFFKLGLVVQTYEEEIKK